MSKAKKSKSNYSIADIEKDRPMIKGFLEHHTELEGQGWQFYSCHRCHLYLEIAMWQKPAVYASNEGVKFAGTINKEQDKAIKKFYKTLDKATKEIQKHGFCVVNCTEQIHTILDRFGKERVINIDKDEVRKGGIKFE